MPRRRVLMVVEGATENVVLNKLLAAHLGALGIFMAPKILGKASGKGGNVTFARVVNDVCDIFRQEPAGTITTFIDFYGRAGDWPGEKSAGQSSSAESATQIENELTRAVCKRLGDNGPKLNFIPYIQLHELEALLFCQPDLLAEVFGAAEREPQVLAIAQQFQNCEEINNGPLTAPSKRIEAIFGSYKKGRGQRSHARLYSERAQLALVRQGCPRFHAWVTQLESLSQIDG